MAIREIELEVYARVGLTKEAYDILRRLKKERKQSMTRLISDMVVDNFAGISETSIKPPIPNT